MRVTLTVKLAEVVEGVDLSECEEGEIVELLDSEARLLIAGGWAEPVSAEERISSGGARRSDIAADRAVTSLRRS
jgi:hypothetical protein